MAKLNSSPIVQADLEEWLDSTSDFDFEIRTLKLLKDRGVIALHGGSYADPLTNLKRQFDIRGQIRPKLQWRSGLYEFRLAIECKNIGENFPLIIQCLPREESESYHEFLATSESCANNIRVDRHRSAYRAQDLVGKSLSQMGRDAKKEITATDSDVYEKWSQALASAGDFARSIGNDFGKSVNFICMIPVVVVPNERLWVTSYDNTGRRLTPPEQVDAVSFFVADSAIWNHGNLDVPFSFSHLQFVTTNGLIQLIDVLKTDNAVERYFWEDTVDAYLNDHAEGNLPGQKPAS